MTPALKGSARGLLDPCPSLTDHLQPSADDHHPLSTTTLPTEASHSGAFEGALPVCGTISEPAGGPTTADLERARVIDLTREAGSSEAASLAEAVTTAIIPHLDRKRPLGTEGLETKRGEVGAILGGLLRAAFRDRPVAAQRRPEASLWKHSTLGRRVFWGAVEAMQAAGLVGVKTGIRIPPQPFGDAGYDGKPTCVWATPKLVALAAEHGVTPATVVRDWPISRAAETLQPKIEHRDLVVCRDLDDKTLAHLSPAQEAIAETMRTYVARLNEALQQADIRGCLAPAFRRVFKHDLRLGGRLYALGAANVQTLSEQEREAVTINGEPVVEIDVRASQLTVFLALTGTRDLPEGDLYGVGEGIPRDAAKAWCVQTFATGKPTTRWSDRAPAVAKAIKPGLIREAMAAAYPAFREPLQRIVPGDVLAGLPTRRHGWAVGQYLTFRESEAVSGAIGYVLGRGFPVLPVHDALVVPKSAEAHAREGLTRGFQFRVGIIPRLH